METVDKPLSETAAKVLAIMYTRAFSSNGPHSEGVDLICINDIGKSYISDKVGISEKRVSNILTELILLKYIERVEPTWYKINNDRISVDYNIVEIKASYRFY